LAEFNLDAARAAIAGRGFDPTRAESDFRTEWSDGTFQGFPGTLDYRERTLRAAHELGAAIKWRQRNSGTDFGQFPGARAQPTAPKPPTWSVSPKIKAAPTVFSKTGPASKLKLKADGRSKKPKDSRTKAAKLAKAETRPDAKSDTASEWKPLAGLALRD
jgi:hypothetical protein